MSEINNASEKTVNEWGMRVAVFSFLTKKTNKTKEKKRRGRPRVVKVEFN